MFGSFRDVFTFTLKKYAVFITTQSIQEWSIFKRIQFIKTLAFQTSSVMSSKVAQIIRQVSFSSPGYRLHWHLHNLSLQCLHLILTPLLCEDPFTNLSFLMPCGSSHSCPVITLRKSWDLHGNLLIPYARKTVRLVETLVFPVRQIWIWNYSSITY